MDEKEYKKFISELDREPNKVAAQSGRSHGTRELMAVLRSAQQ